MTAARVSELSRSIALQPGWQPGAAGLAVASICTVVVARAGSAIPWLEIRAPLAGLVFLAAGLLIGSERLVGFASLPMLAGALLSVEPIDGPAWGRSLIVGCLWYVALELAWASVERRDGVERAEAIGRQRRREVSQVVIVAIAVGLGSALLATVAPARSLFVRGVVIAGFLAALIAAADRLTTSRPETDEPGDQPVIG